MGLPTSEELQKQEMLKKFMSEVWIVDFLSLIYYQLLDWFICFVFGYVLQHPEMDFSRAKIS